MIELSNINRSKPQTLKPLYDIKPKYPLLIRAPLKVAPLLSPIF
jgi:hypothetical protein